jgi:hypothetical protein
MDRYVRGLALLLVLGVACGGGGLPGGEVEAAAQEVVEALEARDFGRLADLVQPDDGVLLSPYAYVEPGTHVTLTAADLRRVAEGKTIERVWGHHDGTGESIRLPFREYFERFVYDAPYLEDGRVAVDRRQGGGNTVDNAAEVWPEGRIVEYHLPGRDPRYEGMDWRSLRLVLVDEGGHWWLVGIVHDEWTI